MYSKSIDKITAKTSNFCSRLESSAFSSIRKVLPDGMIGQACCDADHDYRQRQKDGAESGAEGAKNGADCCCRRWHIIALTKKWKAPKSSFLR